VKVLPHSSASGCRWSRLTDTPSSLASDPARTTLYRTTSSNTPETTRESWGFLYRGEGGFGRVTGCWREAREGLDWRASWEDWSIVTERSVIMLLLIQLVMIKFNLFELQFSKSLSRSENVEYSIFLFRKPVFCSSRVDRAYT